ncbi:Ferulic acid decarboxylase 1 [Colletotrichum siamense]|uniref:Ferulic acid decarboxylase 1 n=1 Tax=Colletotrichum siamense TaxID=690259 RepID=UPI001872B39E|nr:Ferulic acid decarboxylase 1 [Colletotrichum siamense]KAF5497321.1 Ferulic acid decarboxylase 1 [Colletotrichum siamense]
MISRTTLYRSSTAAGRLRKVYQRPFAAAEHFKCNYSHSSADKRCQEPDAIEAQLDFRKFLDILRYDNDLAEINDEVDPHLEVGAIVRRVSEVNDKAPLFNNVKGTRNGLWRMFGNAASLRQDEVERFGRVARNLGLPPKSSWKEISDRFMSWKKAAPLPPKVLQTGPCKQNKMFGDEINLEDLPAPYLHEGDGGKYLQTYGIHVLQTPDKSWTNWSIFRGMVHDQKHLVCLVGSGQHNSIIRDKWIENGSNEMPWALALGVPPIASIVASMPVPEGVSESEYIGAVTGKPLDMVKCELSDLLVPVNSEVVLEGTMSFTKKGPEGPFGDYLALVFDNEQKMGPLFRVEAITYRDNPILPISCPGNIVDESHTTAQLAAPELLLLCQEHGLPIKEAFAPVETLATWCALQVDTEKLRDMETTPEDFCRKLGSIAFHNKSCMLINRILLVGDDIDVYNWDKVMWAFTTRCRPVHDEYMFDDVGCHPLTPYMSQIPGTSRRGGKLVSDCLIRSEYIKPRNFKHVDFENSYPEDIKQKVLKNWSAMGFSS